MHDDMLGHASLAKRVQRIYSSEYQPLKSYWAATIRCPKPSQGTREQFSASQALQRLALSLLTFYSNKQSC